LGLSAPESSGAGGIRAFFFAYFAFIGIFSPYLSLYLSARGLAIVEIAVLLAVPLLMRIVAPPFWGWLADRGGNRVTLLRVTAAAALAVLVLFPIAGSAATLGLLMLVLFFLTAAHMPIGEAMALSVSGSDAGRYGQLRVWGSIGFVVTVLCAGPLLDLWGVGALPWLMAAAMALLVAVTFRLPRPATPEVSTAVPPAAPIGRRFREPAIQAFLLSGFLMIFAHAALYSFFSLFLERAGYSKTAIGMIWAVGVVAEIVLFSVQRHLFQRVSAMQLLAASFLVCALRFAMIGLSDGALWLILQAQLMHAVTFGLHHSATMATLQRWFDPRQQARAQAGYAVIGYGLGGSLGGLTAGWVWEHVSPEAAFLVAAAAGFAGWFAVQASARFERRALARAAG
jgi:MFS transporter, PPP family, 3-phenylpropionic acid transporter